MQMKVKYLHALTADENDFVCEYRLNFCQSHSIHVMCGSQANLMLSFLASFLGDYSAFPSYPTAVLHSEVSLDGCDYLLCVLHEEDGMRLSANFDSEHLIHNPKDTSHYVKSICRLDDADHNIFLSRQANLPVIPKGESTRILFAFEHWLAEIEGQKDNKKPLYITDLLDCLDESTDLSPLLDRLSRLQRQVFLTCRTPKHFLHPDAELILV